MGKWGRDAKETLRGGNPPCVVVKNPFEPPVKAKITPTNPVNVKVNPTPILKIKENGNIHSSGSVKE